MTGDLVPTGVETPDLEALEDRAYLLIDCPRCGQDHSWVATDGTVFDAEPAMAGHARLEPTP